MSRLHPLRIPPDDGGTSFSDCPHLARLTLTGVTMSNIVEINRDSTYSSCSKALPWLQSQHFDLLARPDDAADGVLAKLHPVPAAPHFKEEGCSKLLLADRAHLTIHHGSKEVSGYSLVLSPNPLQTPRSPSTPDPNKPGSGMSVRSNKLGFQLTANNYTLGSSRRLARR